VIGFLESAVSLSTNTTPRRKRGEERRVRERERMGGAKPIKRGTGLC